LDSHLSAYDNMLEHTTSLDSTLYTKCCQVKYLAIWPDDIHLAQKVLLAPSAPLRGESALSLVFTVVLVTDVLLQLDHVPGTTYLPDKEVSCTEFRKQLKTFMFQMDCGAL